MLNTLTFNMDRAMLRGLLDAVEEWEISDHEAFAEDVQFLVSTCLRMLDGIKSHWQYTWSVMKRVALNDHGLEVQRRRSLHLFTLGAQTGRKALGLAKVFPPVAVAAPEDLSRLEDEVQYCERSYSAADDTYQFKNASWESWDCESRQQRGERE